MMGQTTPVCLKSFMLMQGHNELAQAEIYFRILRISVEIQSREWIR